MLVFEAFPMSLIMSCRSDEWTSRCNAATAVEPVFDVAFDLVFDLVFALVFGPVFDVAFALVFELVLQLYQYDVAHHLTNGHLQLQRCGCSGVSRYKCHLCQIPFANS